MAARTCWRKWSTLLAVEGPKQMAEIEAAYDAGDCEGVMRAAHTLKGSVSLFGARSRDGCRTARRAIGGASGRWTSSPQPGRTCKDASPNCIGAGTSKIHGAVTRRRRNNSIAGGADENSHRRRQPAVAQRGQTAHRDLGARARRGGERRPGAGKSCSETMRRGWRFSIGKCPAWTASTSAAA